MLHRNIEGSPHRAKAPGKEMIEERAAKILPIDSGHARFCIRVISDPFEPEIEIPV